MNQLGVSARAQRKNALHHVYPNEQAFEDAIVESGDPLHIPPLLDELKAIADKVADKGLAVGSLVAPVWPGTVGASAMGSDEDREKFLLAVKKACRIAKIFNDHGVRKYGVIRIDSAEGPENWSKDPDANQDTIAATFPMTNASRMFMPAGSPSRVRPPRSPRT